MIAVLQAQLHVRRVRKVLVVVVARLRYELGDRALRLDRADLAVDRIALLIQVLDAVSDLLNRLLRKKGIDALVTEDQIKLPDLRTALTCRARRLFISLRTPDRPAKKPAPLAVPSRAQ